MPERPAAVSANQNSVIFVHVKTNNMPKSKQRKHHHPEHHPAGTHVEKSTRNRSIVPVAIFFFALLGLGISFFAAGASVIWLLLGTIAGAALGYFFGKQMDKSMTNK